MFSVSGIANGAGSLVSKSKKREASGLAQESKSYPEDDESCSVRNGLGAFRGDANSSDAALDGASSAGEFPSPHGDSPREDGLSKMGTGAFRPGDTAGFDVSTR